MTILNSASKKCERLTKVANNVINRLQC